MRSVYCVFNYDGYHSYLENVYATAEAAIEAQDRLRLLDSWDDWIIKTMDMREDASHIPASRGLDIEE